MSLDNVPMKDAKIKRKDHVTCLNSKANAVKIGEKMVTVNPTLLFTRLSALAGREENVASYFEYELTPFPMSLFKDGLMRKLDKASLRSLILTKESSSSDYSKKVIDGGALLHQVQWPLNVTYNELLDIHVRTVRKQFGECHVVFDGYDVPHIKDQEHLCRTAKSKTPEIQFRVDMCVVVKHEDFL